MSLDVESFIGYLEKVEDIGSGGILWMSVVKEDVLFMEYL